MPCHNEVYHHHRRARALRRSHKERMMGYMSAQCCTEPGSYQRQKNETLFYGGTHLSTRTTAFRVYVLVLVTQSWFDLCAGC
jgi:hypothetical protein